MAHLEPRRLRPLSTPRAAAVAGIVFAVLFTVSIVLLRTTLPGDPFSEAAWAGPRGVRIKIALIVSPLAGIAFLWFLGVIRDRLGDYEDRFFSTVMLGSGLLFLAMVFVSMAIAGGILATARHVATPDDDLVYFGREVMLQINGVYAVRMAGVFMISLGTIWLRTALMPRLLVITTYTLALFLLLVVSLSVWVALVFPAWVLLISLYILTNPLAHQN
ncbi:hypothetical protein [Nocardia bovistercoris]|uniref:DUF4386 family protein n=1 Tax=Nocardia bovistercoris TaxID=2785916 RepID=A0A931N4D5_9NOCA|nr:hypothetical protein [Nocardia bovistercoris]MBH0778131.1 hypothetical protein [Nocardia bovistercoris]